MGNHSIAFWFGVGLVAINPIIGLGGAALCSYLAIKTKRKRFYAIMGITIYAVSWVMMLLGGWLAGPEGYILVKDLFIKIIQIFK
ncbi:MAG: hypothetical protein HY920_00985 [Elusimicrobia bacterium]|nr:hypothetical protein [Elusimicrobiota bacterium]